MSLPHDAMSYADPEFFVRGGQTLTTFFFSSFFSFLVDQWWEDPNTTISGPSSARQRNAIEMFFACVLMMA